MYIRDLKWGFDVLERNKGCLGAVAQWDWAIDNNEDKEEENVARIWAEVIKKIFFLKLIKENIKKLYNYAEGLIQQ